MNVVNLIKENIVANKNGMIMADYIGSGMYSASFLANLPKSAVIDHIKVDGKFLEDVNTRKIRFHRELTEPVNGETWKVAATVWFEEDDLDLYFKLSNYVVQDFEVYYHLEAVVE